MKKTRKLLVIILSTIFSIAFTLSISFIILVQTNFGQRQIKKAILNIAKKSNIEIEVKSISAKFPFSITMKEGSIKYNRNEIKFDDLSFGLSIKSLIKKEIYLTKIHSKDIHIYLNKEIKEKNKKGNIDLNNNNGQIKKYDFNFPMTLSINHINFENLHINDEEKISLDGSLFIKKGLTRLLTDLNISKDDNNIIFEINGSKTKNYIKTKAKISVEDLSFLKKYIHFEDNIFTRDLQFDLKLKSTSTFDNFIKTVFNEQNSTNKIFVNGNGQIKFKNLSKYNVDPFNAQINFYIKPGLHIDLSHINIKNNLLKAFIKGEITNNTKINHFEGSLEFFDLSYLNNFLNFPIKGSFSSLFKTKGNSISLDYKLSNLHIEKYFFSLFDGTINALYEDGKINGDFTKNFITLGERFSITSQFSYDIFNKLNLNNLNINSTSINISSNLDIEKNWAINGLMKGKIDNLFFLKELIPYKLNGEIDFSSNIKFENENQNIYINGSFSDYYFNNLIGDKITFDFNLNNIYKEISHSSNLVFENLKYHAIKFDNIDAKIEGTISKSSFLITSNGIWKNPFNTNVEGKALFVNDKLSIQIESLKGTLFEKPLNLENSSQINIGKDFFEIKDLLLKMPKSSINTNILFSKENSYIKLDANHIPLDFLPFSGIDIDITGYGSLKADINQKDKIALGKIDIDIENILLTSNENKNVKGHGHVNIEIDDDATKIRGKILSRNIEMAKVDLFLPLNISLNPFSYTPLVKNELSGEISVNSNVDDIIDFIYLDDQKIDGFLKCDLKFADTLENPKIYGKCNFIDGIYENYTTGTMLKDVFSEFEFKNHMLHLKNFTANDMGRGKISAKGNLDLSKDSKYKYDLSLNLESIKLIHTDLTSATISGNMQVNGNIEKAFAKGALELEKGDFYIPEKIPSFMPDMDVEFINMSKEEKKKISEEKKYYPINLDIFIKSSDNIYIKGRGVNAKLRGKVKLSGTTQDIIPHGKLELIKGSYSFSGRTFDLKEGSLTFSGIAGSIPILYIKAITMQSGVELIATLKGPLNSPALSFSSKPPLSVSSIISLLLFGQDLSGISALQALQVANTLANLSNESNTSLEGSKKSLGIDRLAIISSEGEVEDNPDQIAVEVGKYITRGLLVSIKQGTEEGSSNASVEIDLGLGFMFQFETIQEEEQTRFTVKWNHSF